MHIDEEVRLLGAAEETEEAGVIGALVELGIPGAISRGAADVLLGGEGHGEQMDGAAEGGGADGGGRAWAAIEVDAADPLSGKESPGVVGGGVGVVEGNAIEVDVVIAVRESAEIGLRLPETDAIAAGGECAGDDLDDLAEVGDRRGEVLDIGAGNQRLRGTLFNEAAAGCILRGNGIDAGIHRDHLRNGVDG